MPDDISATPVPRLSLPQRMLGVLFSPGETFRSIAAHPTWAVVLVVQLVVVAAAFAVFLSTEVGKAAHIDQAVSTVESFGGTVDDAAYGRIQGQADYAWIVQPASVLFIGPLFTALLAGILYGVFTVLGGESTFKHVLAVVAHAGVVTMLQPLFTMPLNYQRQNMSSATNLAVFLPMLDEGSFLGALLGVLDLFYIWYAIVLAIGLGAIYRRRATPIAVGLLSVFVVIGVAVATLKVVLGGR